MNLNTPITTAARRITREVNRGTAGVDYLFTTDGECVGSIQTGCWFPEGAGPNYQLRFSANGGVSHRNVQDRLDAVIAHPDDKDAELDYLLKLDVERRYSN
jgi:hypothetical protein